MKPELYTTTAPFLGYAIDSPQGFGLAPKPRAAKRKRVLHRGNAHLLTIGGTGSGKTNLMIANLLLYRGSAIVVDVRGDCARATERFRRRELGQKTHVLDPFRVLGRKRDRLDPLDIAQLPNVSPDIEAQTIAATIMADHRTARDPYWYFTGSALIAAIIARGLSGSGDDTDSFSAVIDILYADDVAYEVAKVLDLEKMLMGKFAHRGLASFLQIPDNNAATRSCVISTVQSCLEPFRAEQVMASLTKSTIDLNDLLQGLPTTIYLVVPVERMHSHSMLLRLWLDLLLQVLLRRVRPPEIPTLVALDEAAQLGSSPAVQTVATYLRASGVRLWTMWQDLSQIRSRYPQDWQTLVNNTSALTFLPGTGLAARELAEIAGVDPERIKSLKRHQQLVCETAKQPRIVRTARYWQEKLFEYRHDPLPRFEREPGR